ncbi:MAG: hypothetical protein IBX72_15455 [Nitrospirae bacterium]|nr:hypothetical protein [Nitrospirota bacterium]
MAVVLKNEQYLIAMFQPVFGKLVEYGRQMRILQRKTDRQRRANNPDNYNPDGTIKKGKRLKWKRSKGYIETQAKIRELHRLVKETRKAALNELSSTLVALGCLFKTEKNKYKSWQSNYGKSVGSYAPSYFIKDVYSKAENAGNEAVKLPLKNALSQMCVCGVKRKKNLSERLHSCECGCISQRDILSAYLGLFCSPDLGEWESIAREYHNADRQLLTASHRVYSSQAASRQNSGFVLCLDKRQQSCSCRNEDGHLGENFGNVQVFKDLKTLVGELSLNRKSVQLSSGIPCL